MNMEEFDRWLNDYEEAKSKGRGSPRMDLLQGVICILMLSPFGHDELEQEMQAEVRRLIEDVRSIAITTGLDMPMIGGVEFVNALQIYLHLNVCRLNPGHDPRVRDVSLEALEQMKADLLQIALQESSRGEIGPAAA